MPDPTLSAAVLEAMTLCPTNVREIQTLEIRQPNSLYTIPLLKIAFLIDTTGSMEGLIETLKDAVATLATDLASAFSVVQFALIEFKDISTVITGSTFVEVAPFLIALDTFTATGGGAWPEDGYGAITLACADLAWGASEGEARAVFLLTDAPSHEDNSTLVEAQTALLATGASFIMGPYSNSSYNSLIEATEGNYIGYETFADSESLQAQVVAVLQELRGNIGLDPVYLVNDITDFTAFIEPVGTAEPIEVTFSPRCFALNIADSGETGLKGISITIDNTDLAVSRYLAAAALNSSPVEVRFRVYLSNDLTGPQNNPPITLYLGPIEVSGNTVSSEARWIDIQNAPFPNTYYTRKRFPGL